STLSFGPIHANAERQRGTNRGRMVRTMNRAGKWFCWAVTAVLVLALVAALGVSASAKTKIRQTLHPTVHAPHASGLAKLALRTGSQGTFTIKARGLSGGQSFDVVVNGVKVGALVSGAGGNGVAKF